MRYISEETAKRHLVNLHACGSIDRTGSVTGMQNRFGWKKAGQVRVGGYIYNVGPDEVKRLRNIGVLKGESK